MKGNNQPKERRDGRKEGGRRRTRNPTDGVLSATVSAGKAYRREVVAALAADLRAKRIAPKTGDALKSIIKGTYHAPAPDLKAIVQTLQGQRVITLAKTGALTVAKEGSL